MLNHEAIMIRTNSMWVSERMALDLLTPSQITRAKENGRLRAQKRNDKKNGRWDYNLWDLLKLCDIQRKTRNDKILKY